MKKTKDKYQSMIIERNKLYVSGDNPKRLKELIDKINYFEYGIKL